MKFRYKPLFSILLSFVMFFSSQALFAHDDHDHDSEPPSLVEDADEVDIEDWEGSWTNVASAIDAEELEEDIAEMAQEHGETPEEFKEDFVENAGTSFYSFKFDGDKVSFYDRKIEDDLEPLYTITYKYFATYEATFGNHSFNWFIFEATDLPEIEEIYDKDTDSDDKDENEMNPGDFKYLALMDVHGEEALAHFHPRYASEVDELWERGDWFPIFVSADVPVEQYVSMLDHGDHDDH